MGVLQSLGDALASGFTGQNTQDVIDKEDLMRSEIPLRGAQTKKALADADTARVNALRTQRQLDARDRVVEDSASGKQPSLGDLMDAGFGNFGDVTAGQGHVQEQGFRAILGDPNANPAARLAAQAGVKGEVPNPYQALPADYVDMRALPPPGEKPNEGLSQTGAATIDQKGSVADLNRAKLLLAKMDSSGVSGMTPEEIGFLAHVRNNGGPAPTFGMGKNADRTSYNKALYLDSAGIPITYESLGLKTPTNGVSPTSALPAGTPTPAAAGDATVARTSDVKGATAAMRQLNIKLGMVNAQEITALKNYDLMMGYAEKLGRTGGTLWNKALNDWKMGITGDPETADFVSALNTAHDEYAKLRSGSTSSQGITDAGRKAADDIFNKNLNLATLRSLRPVIAADAQNMKQGYQTAIESARSGITPTPAAAAAATATPGKTPTAVPPPAALVGLKEGFKRKFGNGQVWTIQNGKPVQVK